jgi:competence protein ComGC
MFSFLGSVISAISNVFGYLKDKQLITAGGAEATTQALKEQADALAIAQNTRQNTAIADAASPDGLLVNDGFKRDK